MRIIQTHRYRNKLPTRDVMIIRNRVCMVLKRYGNGLIKFKKGETNSYTLNDLIEHSFLCRSHFYYQERRIQRDERAQFSNVNFTCFTLLHKISNFQMILFFVL